MLSNQPATAQIDTFDEQTGVAVYIDGQRITLTKEQEALIRAWASGPV